LNRPKGVTEPGVNSSTSCSSSGRAKETWCGQNLSQPRQVGALFGGHHDEPDPALVVLDEQVLAMQAGDFVVPGAALLDGKDGRVLYGAMFDAQLI
jgi:hypothetical protein